MPSFAALLLLNWVYGQRYICIPTQWLKLMQHHHPSLLLAKMVVFCLCPLDGVADFIYFSSGCTKSNHEAEMFLHVRFITHIFWSGSWCARPICWKCLCSRNFWKEKITGSVNTSAECSLVTSDHSELQTLRINANFSNWKRTNVSHTFRLLLVTLY